MEQYLLSLSSPHHFWNPLLSNEEIKKRFARAMFAFSVFPGPSRRWPSSHRAPALISIMPPFVLIEYLLGYLLLITGSRCRSVPSVHATRRPIVKCTAEPAVLVAPGNLWRGRPGERASASHSLHNAMESVHRLVVLSLRWIAGGSTRRSISG